MGSGGDGKWRRWEVRRRREGSMEVGTGVVGGGRGSESWEGGEVENPKKIPKFEREKNYCSCNGISC